MHHVNFPGQLLTLSPPRAGQPADQAIQKLAKSLQVYQLLEQDLHQRKARIMYQIPEIEKSLKAVELLQRKRDADEPVGIELAQSADTLHKVLMSNRACACRRPLTSTCRNRRLPRPLCGK